MKGYIISDFNIDNLTNLLNNSENFKEFQFESAPFGQVTGILVQPKLGKEEIDFCYIWTRPEFILKFKQWLQGVDVNLEEILNEIDQFSNFVIERSKELKYIFCATWVFPSYYKLFATIDLKNQFGLSNTLMQMNLRLINNFHNYKNIFLLNTNKWIESAGKYAFSPKSWYMGKIPYGTDVFVSSADSLKVAFDGILGKSKKLIVLDLDDTLWGGIVGDLGWEKLTLGGHNHIGEALVDFQTYLKSLKSKGILLAIVSKNEEKVAMEAIESHPEMVLRKKDFVSWRINWNDKAQNIVEIAQELNLGLQSIVFIDDNPAERGRVKEELPEVLVPDWPKDKMLYTQALLSLECFNLAQITEEDLERTSYYQADKIREESKLNIGTKEDWLKSLELKVKVEILNNSNLNRATQLLNKTNQMNLITRRLGESEFFNWANEKNHKVWTFRVEDRFGDSGLTGIISCEIQDSILFIKDFLLSCRVFSREIENAMVNTIWKFGQEKKVKEIHALYIPTEKNKLSLEFFKNSKFIQKEDNEFYFIWDMNNEFLLPSHIDIELND